jgi:DNA replication factor GINS
MIEKFALLLEAWRRERYKPELQHLPRDFFSEMSEFASLLREQTRMLDRGTMRSRIALKERENAERMLGELSQLRIKKIILSELSSTPIVATFLTKDEKRLQADLRDLLSDNNERLKRILIGSAIQVEKRPPAKNNLKMIRFLRAVPAIIGIDMKTYGPFKPEDLASMPIENAENLIRRGIAKEVEIQR